LGWTDNVASDAATFLDCIPTLGDHIDKAQIEDFSELPHLLLPEDVTVNVCSTGIEITSACDLILENIVNDSITCHVGFDMEWEFSDAQFTRSSKRTALIQIAFSTTVFLLRVHLLRALPSSLLTILCSPQIIKIATIQKWMLFI
jgi:hypothetical protein